MRVTGSCTDNDSKHTSKLAQKAFEEEGINWWKTPPKSPDCNPIENLWHELKEFNRRLLSQKTRKKKVVKAMSKRPKAELCVHARLATRCHRGRRVKAGLAALREAACWSRSSRVKVVKALSWR